MNNKQVDEFVQRQSMENRVIAGNLRGLLLHSAPGMREEWKFKSTPFYVLNRWVAFIGIKNGQIQLGLCEGVHLEDGLKRLKRKELKQVRYLTFPAWNETLEEAARYYIHQAVEFDLKRSKNRKKR